MPRECHLLDAGRPLTDEVVAWLARGWTGGLLDLSDTLIITPTREAGRRLREALALTAAARGAAVLPGRVAQPEFLFRPRADHTPPPAPPPAALAVWARRLAAAPADAYPALFPRGAAPDDFAAALSWAERLDRLRGELAEEDLDCAGAAQRLADTAEDIARWNDLARLEADYRAALAAAGWSDPQDARRAAAARPETDPAYRRVVVAAVPDPAPLAVRALERLAAERAVTVLIHAPPGREDAFDDWGRPRPEAWAERPLPWTEDAILPCADPAAQADAALEAACAAERPGAPARDRVAFGLADPALAPALDEAARRRGRTLFYPAGLPVARTALGRLIRRLTAWLRQPDYDTTAALLRHPDMRDYLRARGLVVSSVEWLRAWDVFQNECLPGDFDQLCRAAETWRDPTAPARPPPLSPALAELQRLRAAFAADEWRDVLPGALAEIFAARRLDSDNERDARFMAAAEKLREAWRDIVAAGAPLGLTAPEALELLVRGLNRLWLYPERPPRALELNGWLELPWEDAPLLILTGLHEGAAPQTVVGDWLLSDRARAALGLRGNAQAYARDAYLLHTLLASRAPGAVRGYFSRRGATGDPLKPSRLLLACDDDALPGRLLRLLRPPPAADAAPPVSAPSWRFVPPAPHRVWTRLSASRLRDYLDCPFRFYLKHELKLAALDDRRQELDGAGFGEIAHAALARLNTPEFAALRDPAALGDRLAAAVAAEFARRFGGAFSLPLRLQCESLQQRLRRFAEVAADPAEAGWKIVAVEAMFTLELWPGVTLTGRIDRIDRAADGRWRVVDYKTGEKAAAPEAAHRARARPDTPDYARCAADGRRWTDLQLPLYAWALQSGAVAGLDRPAALPRCGYFNLPGELDDVGWQPWPEEKWNDELVADAWACARRVAENIRAGVFWPPQHAASDYDFVELLGADPLTRVDPRNLNGAAGRTA